MAFQQENGTIWLKPNQSQNPKAPKWKGFGLDDEGRKIDVAIWEGKSQRGPWARLQIKPSGGGPERQQQGFQQMRQATEPTRGIDPEDVPPAPEQSSIPF